MQHFRYLLLCITFQNIQCITLNITSQYFDDIIGVLYDDIKFISERLEQINADAIFGLTLANAHLTTALSSTNSDMFSNDQWTKLCVTKNLCNNTHRRTVNKLLSQNPLDKSMKILLQSDIWTQPILWHNNLSTADLSKTIINQKMSQHKAVSLIFQGIPNEKDSDYCLRQLTDDNCQLSDECTDILLDENDARGYPLTHRLLIVLVAKTLKCKRPSTINFSFLIEKYCNEIYQDLIDLESADFPSISRDLAMEQIVLCGMEGYLKFLNKHYIELLMSWRTTFGCYSAFGSNNRLRHRSKKSTIPMDYGCDSHASGVAAAALSLFIRLYIEEQKSQPLK